jgi:hypothetical protein
MHDVDETGVVGVNGEAAIGKIDLRGLRRFIEQGRRNTDGLGDWLGLDRSLWGALLGRRLLLLNGRLHARIVPRAEASNWLFDLRRSGRRDCEARCATEQERPDPGVMYGVHQTVHRPLPLQTALCTRLAVVWVCSRLFGFLKICRVALPVLVLVRL